MISCGWCGHPTDPLSCRYCGRDPAQPWVQRAMSPPIIDTTAGRPELDEAEITRRYEQARADLEQAGHPLTVEALAERLDRSPRTVREWRKRYGLH